MGPGAMHDKKTADVSDLVSSGDYVFRETPDGGLKFVGDFEGLYRENDDPWGQKGDAGRLKDYYLSSRKKIIERIPKLHPNATVLEVGCGLGQVCGQIKAAGAASRVEGVDISAAAVAQAREAYPDIDFHVGNISDSRFSLGNKTYDIILMNQVLWYVLDHLAFILGNCQKILRQGDHLYICNAFMREPQRYGKEIVDGFDGLVSYIVKHAGREYTFVEARLDTAEEHSYDDGHIILCVR